MPHTSRDTSKQAYRLWLERELLPNVVPPTYQEWVKLTLEDQVLVHECWDRDLGLQWLELPPSTKKLNVRPL